MTKVLAIEQIILQITMWSRDHPEAIKELIKLEKKLAELLKPGPDGSVASSEIGKAIAKLSASGIGKYWVFPAVFSVGAISMVGVFGLFKWVLSTPVETSDPTPVEISDPAPTTISGIDPIPMVPNV